MVNKTYLIIADVSIVWAAIIIYLLFPFAQYRMNEHYEWIINENSTQKILLLLGLIYIPFSIWNINKKDTINETIIGSIIVDPKSRKKNFLIILLKFFFIPSMMSLTIDNGLYLIENLKIFLNSSEESIIDIFKLSLFPIIIYGELFLATGIYTIGYIVESKKLNSKIRSIDQTLSGWLVTIICYYPFYLIISIFLPMMTNDFAFFIDQNITLIVWSLLVPIHLFKLWCIIKLGWKCSNLTNRGIVVNGPYSYVRHPHYLSKLAIWWITFLPVLVSDPIYIVGMIFWTYIYILRVITEENHLKKDPEYISYISKVRYRLIPNIY